MRIRKSNNPLYDLDSHPQGWEPFFVPLDLDWVLAACSGRDFFLFLAFFEGVSPPGATYFSLAGKVGKSAPGPMVLDSFTQSS